MFLTGISKTNNTSEKQLKESKNISNNINSSNSTRVNNNKNVQNTRKSSANENKPQIKNTRKISDEKVPVGSNRKDSVRKITKGIKYFDILIRDFGSKLINWDHFIHEKRFIQQKCESYDKYLDKKCWINSLKVFSPIISTLDGLQAAAAGGKKYFWVEILIAQVVHFECMKT